MLPVDDEMLTIVEELAVVEVGIAVLLSLIWMHLANLAVIAAIVVLRRQSLVLRLCVLLVHILHCEITFLLPLSCVFFSSATNRVLDRCGEAVFLVSERRTRFH